MKLSRMLVLGTALVFVCRVAGAADWPQWRGPERTGISQETGLLKEWPKDGPKLVWQKSDLGAGYSTPSVVGDRLYFISNKGMQDESVHALGVKDGNPIWSQRIGKVGVNRGPQYPGARSTPTVDGDVLYALGSDGDLACLTISKGEVRWHKSLRDDFGGSPGQWAYSESPLVDGDVLVCTPGGKTATIVALDKKSGEPIWKSPIPGGDQAAYASAIVLTAGGVKQYVQFLQRGLVGVDAKTGKFLWRYDKTAQGSPANIPTAVAYQNFVYSATGRGGGGLIELKTKDQGVEVDELYLNKKLPSSIGGAVEVSGFLYGTTTGGLQCVDFKTGKMKWQNHGVGAGSVLFADGRLYIHGEGGEVGMVEANSEAYQEKGRFKPPDPPTHKMGKAWAYPALADGRLYIFDFGTLWCYDVKGQAAAVEGPARL